MKVVKVSDEVHASLKALSNAFDVSIGDVIERLTQDSPPPTNLDKVLDQLEMMHGRFDALEVSLSSYYFANSKEDTYLSPAEARQQEIERLRKMEEFQQNAISHPEDEVQ